jgi:hypothetical protein
VINADSMRVYRASHPDGPPDGDEARAPHRLYGVVPRGVLGRPLARHGRNSHRRGSQGRQDPIWRGSLAKALTKGCRPCASGDGRKSVRERYAAAETAEIGRAQQADPAATLPAGHRRSASCARSSHRGGRQVDRGLAGHAARGRRRA